jgi:hypothetical protein
VEFLTSQQPYRPPQPVTGIALLYILIEIEKARIGHDEDALLLLVGEGKVAPSV